MVKVTAIKAEDTYPLRKEILRKNIDLPFRFSGDEDKDTLHFGLYYANELVSVVSFMRATHPAFKGKQYQLRGMATAEKFQGKGLGRILVAESERILKQKHTDIVWCNARVKAVSFYERSGYRKYGDEFFIDKIGGHFVMYKTLKN